VGARAIAFPQHGAAGDTHVDWFEQVPWDRVAAQLREQADAQSGTRGALIGAGLGVVSTVAALQAVGKKPTVPLLLTGAAMGVAYGAADKTLLKGGG
jgi:hypothetical protein